MASIPRQSDPTIGFEPDPVHGFAYCRELPPDVPPGITLDEWRLAHHRSRHPRLRPHVPRVRPGVHCHKARRRMRHRRRPA